MVSESQAAGKRRLGCGSCLGLVIAAVVAILALVYWSSLPITSTFRYASTIASLKSQSGNFSHFPDRIPPDASHAHFHCEVGGPFGDDMMTEVYYELPPEEIEEIYQDYVAKGARFVRPNRDGFFAPGEDVRPPEISEVTGISRFIFFQNPDVEYTAFEAHQGLAINRKAHTILYWNF